MTTTTEQMREAVARAIWNERREDEDRCDTELEDLSKGHSVWYEADAALNALAALREGAPALQPEAYFKRSSEFGPWIEVEPGTEGAVAMSPLSSKGMLDKEAAQPAIECERTGPIDANDLERIAKERPNECFLKGSGVLKLIGAIRQLEREVREAALAAPPAPTEHLGVMMKLAGDDRMKLYGGTHGEPLPKTAAPQLEAAQPAPVPVAQPKDFAAYMDALLKSGSPQVIQAAHILMDWYQGVEPSQPLWSYDISPPQGFIDYVAKNYNGIVEFYTPEWHAKRLWNAAMKNAKPPFVQYAAPAQQEQAPLPMTDERTKFEELVSEGHIALGLPLEWNVKSNRRGDGYLHSGLNDAWLGWQAALLSRHPAQPVSQDIASLKEQNAELVKDAERMNWLEKQEGLELHHPVHMPNTITENRTWLITDIFNDAIGEGKTLRAAIDAAIASATQGGGTP